MAQESDRCFGKPEGLARRLAMWANSLRLNKDYPWLGMGIVDDLECAARCLGVDEDPNEFYTHKVPRQAPEPMEYDL